MVRGLSNFTVIIRFVDVLLVFNTSTAFFGAACQAFTSTGGVP
jgi:hypothetical protein